MRDKEKVKAYNAKYRKENVAKIKKLQDDYYAANRVARIKNAQKWAKNNPDQARTTRQKYIATSQGRYTAVKGAAKTRGIKFLLTKKEAIKLLDEPCFYCGNNDKKGIDRIDSNLNYERGNCVSCCDMCNYMKRTYPQDEFIAQCKKIANHHI